MRRLFSARQKKILRIVAGSLCQKCGNPIDSSFHADHRKAYARGGKTILRNGDALCPQCNLRKGARDDSD